MRNVPPTQNPLEQSGELGCVDTVKRPGLNLFQLNCAPEADPHRAMGIFSFYVNQGTPPEPEILEWIAGIFDKFCGAKNTSNPYTLDDLFGVLGKKRIESIVKERRNRLISHDFFLLKKMFGFSVARSTSLVLAKEKTGYYYKNNLDNVSPELPQTSTIERIFTGDRQIQAIACEYFEYWENRFFINPESFPSKQEFIQTFPEAKRSTLLCNG